MKDYMNLYFTPKAAKYIIFGGALLAQGATGGQLAVLTNAGSEIYRNYLQVKNSLDDREAYFITSADYTGGAGFEDSWGLQYGDNAGTVGMSKGFLCAMEILSTDQFSAFTTEKSGPQTTYQNWESRTVTPTGTEDYILIAYCLVNNNSVPEEDNVFVKVNDGTTDYGECQIAIGDGGIAIQAESRPWSWMKRVTLSSATTYTIQVRCASGNGYYVQNGFFIAIKASEFSDNQFAESTARSLSTSTTYATKTTLAFDPTARAEYYLLAAHYHDSASTSNRVKTKIVQGSTDIVEYTMQPPTDTQLNDFNHFWVKRIHCTGSQSITSQYARFSGTFAIGIGESSLAVLQNVIAPNVNILGSTNILGSSNIL